MIDIHLHTRFSFDSEELPQNYLNAAKHRSVQAIGFSEHYDYDAFLDDGKFPLADLDAYIKSVEELRKNFDGDILCGIEFGYRKEALEKYKSLINDYPFDYVINSVHTLKGRGDCYHDEFFSGKPLKDSYLDYFKAVLESVKADFDYQVVGHIGYVSRYRTGEGAKILYSDFANVLDEILTEIISRDKCLEINASSGTSGSEFLPDIDIIERYLALGGKKLSFGSDAHQASDYMRKAEALTVALKRLGVESLIYYKDKKPVSYKI